MRTTIILIAVACAAASPYHLRAEDSWADRLRAEQAALLTGCATCKPPPRPASLGAGNRAGRRLV